MVFLAGCGSSTDTYDPTLRFPPRADVVVQRTPPTDPTARAHPLDRETFLMQLGAKGGTITNPAELPAADQAELTAALEEFFGTPAAPYVLSPGAIVAQGTLGLNGGKLTQGAGLYKAKCVQCHGLNGDGRGPTGQMVHPPPRDFRQGVFKYIAGPHARIDLLTIRSIVHNGLSGNAMPGFPLLDMVDADSLTIYTIYLSIRGKVERDTIVGLLGEGLDTPIRTFVEARTKDELTAWERSQTLPEHSPPADLTTPERIRRGAAEFNTLGCANCHTDYGRAAPWKYDAWGVPLQPANLTLGEHHGGRTPVDLFRRVRYGIPGAQMPAAPASLSDAHVWDVVAFLTALPVPQHLPDPLRSTIYPEAK
ncbi:MAG: cytochrome c, partial [Gemmataceae bacterium]